MRAATTARGVTAMTRRILIYLAVMIGMILFSGLFIVIFANSLQVSCVRSNGQHPMCRITTVLLGQYPTSSRVVTDVTRAQMDENCDDGCSYRAVLVDSNGDEYPVNEVYTDESIPRRQLDALRAFLSNAEQTTLEYTEPVQWWVVALIGGLDLIGMWAVVGSFLRSARSNQS
jgi:hypothetical protein